MYALQKSKSKTNSRSQIGIDGVTDGVLILPNGHYRTVLQVSSLNFELKSEEEQDALIDTYESFLNSIGTPIQILIRTRAIDMDRYLSDLSDRLAHEKSEIYRSQLRHYEEFVRGLVTTNKILSRNFYIVVPYNAQPKVEFELAQEQLLLLVDIVSRGLSRLGMHTRQLASLELLDLFYSFYSPEQAKINPITQQALQLVNKSCIVKEKFDA